MSDINNLLAEVSKKIDEHSAKFDKQAEAALSEAKKNGELSAQTKDEVDKMAVELNAMKAAEKTLQAAVGDIKQEIANMPMNAAKKIILSAGKVVTESEAVKQFAASVEGGRRVSVGINAALTTGDIEEGILQPQRLPGIQSQPKQRLFIRDLIAPGTTTSNAISWVQQTGFTNNAAAVAENTTKPYSNIDFALKLTPVQTIAHLFKASKQILDDFSQLQSTIDLELRYGLKFVEEQEILFGDGTGAHLEGIIPQATAYAAEFTVEKQNGIDDLRLAMLQAQLARFPASGHVLHFIDWAKIELSKDTLGRYLLANPAALTVPTLWGLPVVATEFDAFKGKFLTGAFNSAAQIFDREQSNVVISTENADDFEKNMITIRCEERLALAVYRPEAFIFGSFTPPAP